MRISTLVNSLHCNLFELTLWIEWTSIIRKINDLFVFIRLLKSIELNDTKCPLINYIFVEIIFSIIHHLGQINNLFKKIINAKNVVVFPMIDSVENRKCYSIESHLHFLDSKFDFNFAFFSVWLQSYRYFDWYFFEWEWFVSFERMVSIVLEQFFGFLVLVQQLLVVLVPAVVPIHE